MPIKFRWPQDINAIRFGATLVWGAVNGIITTIQGTSPLALVNAVAGRIKSLVQYGKCITVDDEIYCNNGKLVTVDDELPAGYKRLLGITFDSNIRYETGEALTGDDDVTMTLDNLSSSGKNVFGSYNGANGKNFSLYIYGSASTGSYFRFGDQLKRPKYGTGKRTITFGKSGTSGFDSDSDVTPDEFTTPANVYIGMLPNSSSAAYAGDIIGSIIVSNRLEWIPCERESDGVIGYYEKYNGNFLEPVGSGLPVSLGYDTSHLTVLSAAGTPEVLTVGEQTATVENLLAVDDIKDEQNIVSGTVTRRCEAVISDGTTPSGRYIGEVGDGNIIVKARETGYEGDIATFEATEAKPLNGLSVNVEPIQDLHGYDAPWPAGGGANKFYYGSNISPTTTNGVTISYDKDTKIFSISGENTKTDGAYIHTSLAPNSYEFPTLSVGQTVYVYFNLPLNTYINITYRDANNTNRGFPIIGGAGGSGDWKLTSFVVPSDFVKLSNVQIGIYKEARQLSATGVKIAVGASQFTAWSPYSNICPISGRTSATVTRTGKNLVKTIGADRTNAQVAYTLNSDGTIKAVGTASGTSWWRAASSDLSLYWPIKAGTYKLTGGKSNNRMLYLIGYLADGTVISNTSIGNVYDKGTGITFTLPQDGYINYQIQIASGEVCDDVFYPMIRFASDTDDTYEPYAGNTYTVQLGDTVYGGQLDVLTGKMMVTDANIASYAGESLPSTWISDRDVYAEGTTPTTGAQVVYKLAEPFEIPLTPTQIDTLIGTNNIWSDAGSVKAYVADGDVIEHVTAQPLRTVEGSNTVSVTSAVDPVQLKIDYYKNE